MIEDPEISMIVRDMGNDEREIFLSVYDGLKAQAIEEALKQTAVKLVEQSRDQAGEARAKLLAVNTELQSLSQWYTEWRAHNDPVTMPEDVGKRRSRMETLIRERATLEDRLKTLAAQETWARR